MDVTLTCNGYDFSSGLLSYAVSYETGHGRTITALDGTEYAGNLTSRPIVKFSMRPMADAQALACYNALTAASPISCAYTDPATSATRTAPHAPERESRICFRFALPGREPLLSGRGNYASGGGRPCIT